MSAKTTVSSSKEDVEDGFLEKLHASPNDEDNRLVYADWLEEHGRVKESELLRTQTKLRKLRDAGEAGLADPSFEMLGVQLRELALVVDQDWRRLVAEAPIELCPTNPANAGATQVRFDFVCPKRWDALTPTDKEDIRHCGSCNKNVHYARDLAVANAYAREGFCVVVDVVQLRRPYDLVVPLQLPDMNPNFVPLAGAMMPLPLPELVVAPTVEKPKPPTLVGRLKALFTR